MIALFVLAFIPLILSIPECDLDSYEVVEEVLKSGGQSHIKLVKEVDPKSIGKASDKSPTSSSSDDVLVVMKVYKRRQEYLR